MSLPSPSLDVHSWSQGETEALEKELHVGRGDHAIPFTFRQASPSWNLFPASRSVNNTKRDKLPSSALIRRREEPIVGYWRMLAGRFPARFGREAAALIGAGAAPGGAPAGDWQKRPLSGFIEAVEYTASVRGAKRWEPESG
jgi:hypothetical protein